MVKQAVLFGLLLVATHALADWERGVAAFRAGDYSTAAAEFQEVTRRSPDFPGGHAMLGESLSQLGDSSGALDAFRKAYELEPANIQYQLNLTRGYVAVGRFAEACQLTGRISPFSLPEPQRAVLEQLRQAAAQATGGNC